MFSFFKISAILSVFFLLCWLVPGVGFAKGALKPVWLTFSHGKVSDGYQVKIRGDRPFKVDNHFLITDPPRLVVDIANAKVGKNIYIKVDKPEIAMIRAANREQRVRVVLDLPKDSSQKYKFIEKNNRVLIVLLGDKPAAQKGEVEEHANLAEGYVSIRLYKAELTDFFAIISKSSGHRIDVDEAIKIPISLRLVDVSWQDALAKVVKLYSLEIEEQEGRWYVIQAGKR